MFPALTTGTRAESGRLRWEWLAEKHWCGRQSVPQGLKPLFQTRTFRRGSSHALSKRRRALHGRLDARSRKRCWDPRFPLRSGVAPAVAALAALAKKRLLASAEAAPSPRPDGRALD